MNLQIISLDNYHLGNIQKVCEAMNQINVQTKFNIVSNNRETTLVVFPGMGNPDNSFYRKVYFLIENEALKLGFKEVDISIRWPGHINEKRESVGTLLFDEAINCALSKIRELEDNNKNYTLLGRSFGAIVACYCALSAKLKGLKKIILWGPPPYWLLWKMFKKDLMSNSKIAIDKGLMISETFFSSAIPIETLLPLLNYPITIATGTEDTYSPPAFLEYLRSLTGNKTNVYFKLVTGAIHEMTYDSPAWEEYVEILFV